MTFQEYYDNKKRSIERALARVFDDAPASLTPFYEMLSYPLLAKSKRVRPFLVFATHEVFGGRDEDVLAPALALELVHTYSLVHDDLPAMDDDDLRRGLPTVHVKYGEANAILTGDALLTHAFTLIAESTLQPDVTIRLVGELSRAAGPAGMVGGQYLDLLNENNDIALDALKELHAYKTGALIRAAVRMGGIAGGASDDDLMKLSLYGESVGLAFQIQDDVLDVIGNEGELGKPVGSDKEQAKRTYVDLMGLEGAKAFAEELTENAVKVLVPFGPRAEHLVALAEYIVRRTH